MSENRVLSVFVASYNLENYIKECIDSIINQDYKNIRIIVVDDGSQDKTVDILKKYEENGDIELYTKENGGTGSVRNFMLSICNTDFFTFVDGDDKISKDCFSSNMSLFDDNNIDVVQYPILFRWQTDDEDLNKPNPQIFESKKDIFEQYLSQKMTFCMCDKIFRRSAFPQLNFKENIFYEDVNSNMQIALCANRMAYSDKGIYYYRRTVNSNITRKMTFKKMSDYVNVISDFIYQSNQNNASFNSQYIYLSHWLRNYDFMAISEFSDYEKMLLNKELDKVNISEIKALLLLLSGRISYKKFRAIISLAKNNLESAIKISNNKNNR